MNKKLLYGILFCFAFTMLGCSGREPSSSPEEITLTLGAYTVPKEVYEKEIIPAFKDYWMKETGQRIRFEESYIASGAQSRAILAGFEADIAALSLEGDIERLSAAGLITHDWKSGATNGFVTRSVVAVAYREGNPKKLHDWSDLARPGVEVIYPNPKTSGGAMWDINAVYGAGLKISEAHNGAPDAAAAKRLLKAIQHNVKVMDKSGRASVTTFENGIGDALVTYENEIILRNKQGRTIPYFVPKATILIENPIAVIDKNVDKHGNRAAAEAFAAFVLTPDVQRMFARYGFRSIDNTVTAEFSDQYPVPELLFSIDYLGGWEKVFDEIYGPQGVWTIIIEELAHE